MQLSNHIKRSSAITPTAGAAGTDDIEGTVLDMQGFQGVQMYARFGAITASAVTSVKAQQGDESDGSDMADLEGTAQTVAVADAGEAFIIDLYKPTKRYVRLYVDRGTANAVVAEAHYVQYEPTTIPPSATTGFNQESHVSPAEGTA